MLSKALDAMKIHSCHLIKGSGGVGGEKENCTHNPWLLSSALWPCLSIEARERESKRREGRREGAGDKSKLQ